MPEGLTKNPIVAPVVSTLDLTAAVVARVVALANDRLMAATNRDGEAVSAASSSSRPPNLDPVRGDFGMKAQGISPGEAAAVLRNSITRSRQVTHQASGAAPDPRLRRLIDSSN